MAGINGGLLGITRTTTTVSGIGVWTVDEQVLRRRDNTWPRDDFPLLLSPSLWLDASNSSSITEISGAVSQWNDLSGNTNNATQSTASARPVVTPTGLNSLNVMTFDNSNDGMSTSLTVNRNYTISFVGKQVSSTSTCRMIQSSTQNRLISIRRSTGNNVFLGTDVVSSQYGADNTYLMGVLIVSTTATSTYHANGTNIAIGSPASADWGTLTLGAVGSYSEPFNGSLAELLVFPSALSNSDRERLEGYYATKWGMMSVLPSGHPYKV